MKKILSLGVAAAVLSMTAVAASAAISPVISGDAVAGETVVVEIVAEGITSTAAQFNVVAEGLTLESYTATTNGFAAFNEETGKFAWAHTAAPADGDVLLTLTYIVDAAADEEISVSLTPDAGFEADVDAAPAVSVVIDGEEPVEDPEEPTEEPEEPTEDPGLVEDPEEPTEEPEEPTEEPEEPTNPDTGVALAVVPAIVAGAAIVVAKKRK